MFPLKYLFIPNVHTGKNTLIGRRVNGTILASCFQFYETFVEFCFMFDKKYMCWAVFNYSPICRALPSLLEKFLRAAGTPRFWLQQLGSGWLESTKQKITTLKNFESTCLTFSRNNPTVVRFAFSRCG